MSQGFERALLVAGMLLLPPVSGMAADNREAGSSPTGPHRQASAPATPDTEELSLKAPDLVLVFYDPRGERKEDHVMGHVLRGQAPNQAMWLFVSNVRWTLGLRPQGRKDAPLREWREVGVALGRVVAHELIHAMAPAQPHAEEGLMRHSLDRHGLQAKDLIVDARCARAFLAGLAARRAHDPEMVPATIVAGP